MKEMSYANAIKLLENAVPSHGCVRLEEARQKAINAMEKQIPMKPMAAVLGVERCIERPCGNCGEALNGPFWDYCPSCGQRVDWG